MMKKLCALRLVFSLTAALSTTNPLVRQAMLVEDWTEFDRLTAVLAYSTDDYNVLLADYFRHVAYDELTLAIVQQSDFCENKLVAVAGGSISSSFCSLVIGSELG